MTRRGGKAILLPTLPQMWPLGARLSSPHAPPPSSPQHGLSPGSPDLRPSPPWPDAALPSLWRLLWRLASSLSLLCWRLPPPGIPPALVCVPPRDSASGSLLGHLLCKNLGLLGHGGWGGVPRGAWVRKGTFPALFLLPPG